MKKKITLKKTPFINSETGFFAIPAFKIKLNKAAHGDKTLLPPMSHQGLV